MPTKSQTLGGREKLLLCSFMALMSFIFFVEASIPQTLNIHGKLTNLSGIAEEGTFSINFTIYDASTGGNALYSTVNVVSTDSNGIYTTILSGVDLDFNAARYLGVKVGSDSEMTPRNNLTSTPSSLAAWREDSDNLFYETGNVTIGSTSSTGLLGLISSFTESIFSIDNTAALGDSVIKFQIGGSTKLTAGIRDAGSNDPFEFNYGDGLDSSPELSITTDDILIGEPTTQSASLIFNNKLENTCPFIGDVNVDDTNYLVLPVLTCTYDDFSNGIEGQLLVIICPRPSGVTITVADTPREIGLSGGNNFVCANAGDTLTLFMGPPPFNEWFELSRSFNT